MELKKPLLCILFIVILAVSQMLIVLYHINGLSFHFPIKRRDDPIKRRDDPIKRRDDPIKHIDDPIKHGDDAIRKTYNPPLFAFMSQTEECLPKHWLTNDYVGNSTLCNCRVYILSYRRQCIDTSALSHVKYIFIANIAWTSGRNALLLEARKKHNYLYYIFMDDDVELGYNSYTRTENISRRIPPLRIFTEFLLDYQPVAVGTDYNFWNQAELVVNRWHTVCKYPKLPRVLPVGHIDQCFVAYHSGTFGSVLPYVEKYDVIHFWLSALYATMAVQIAFHGQLVYFPEIKANNPKHRYAGGKPEVVTNITIRREMIETLRQGAPPQFRNNSVFEMAYNYPIWTRTVHTLCMDPPPARSPVIPYRVMP